MIAKAPPFVTHISRFRNNSPTENAFSQDSNREKSIRWAGSLAGRLGRGPLGWLDRSTAESPAQRENVARHATVFSTCVGSSSKHQHLAPDGRQLSPVARRAHGARWQESQHRGRDSLCQSCLSHANAQSCERAPLGGISRKIVERNDCPVPPHPVNPDQRFCSGAGGLDIGPFATKGAP